jgi:mono/diheme cytochrome c family protein
VRRSFKLVRAIRVVVAAALFPLFISGIRAAETNSDAGLVVTFTSVREPLVSDISIAPNVWLFVEEGKSAAPFLPGGKFRAIWEGNLNAELRGDFAFQAELNGALKLELNGKSVYEVSGNGTTAKLSNVVQLNKGANSLRATYTSPEKGNAFVRLSWTEKGPFTSPIPLASLTHATTPELTKSLQLRLGRELFVEYRCFNCHKNRYEQSIPELNRDAPSFAGIGARRNYEWMARWILDPKASRASVHMPKVLHGPKAKDDAEAIAAYLSSLKTGGEVSIPEPKIKTKPDNLADNGSPPDQPDARKPLFESLNCVACHNKPGEDQPEKISLKHVAQKFAPGKLPEFLRAPEAHFAWIRMPNFHLTSKEATEISEYLLTKADQPEARSVPTDKSLVERGQKLVQETGCLNCHGGGTENKFQAPGLSTLTAPDDAPSTPSPLNGERAGVRGAIDRGVPFSKNWNKGCLAIDPKPDSKAPDFQFSADQRDALNAFGQTDLQSLTRHVPAEFAERETHLLNCLACHGQPEGFPPLDILGGKLKPEWAARFIGGEIPYKPRAEKHPKGEPWLEMRMPAFKSRATALAPGLTAGHGYPPKTPAEPPVDPELARVGQKLIGKDGGFSCVSCHGVGKMEAMEVFESEGINLSWSAERLLPEYYRRWMRSPMSIDPQTKMPAYFEDGKSPLTEVFNGDAEKQIGAVWQYLRLGTNMPPPSLPAQ